MTTITIVTPWKDSPELADGYWAAIDAADADEVIVIDNASEPPLPFGVRMPDLGFNGANNEGLRRATSDAVLFLNNDVVHLHPDWLAPIRAHLKPGRLVGAQLRPDEHTRVDGRLFPYLDGWCLAGMRQDLLDLGGWDESLAEPAYWGDNLLCLKARLQGFRLVQVDVGLRHIGNGTSRKNVARREAASAANHKVFIEAARASM